MIKLLEPLWPILATLCLLFYFWGEVAFYPNAFLFSLNGDGPKNYYTFLYYLKQDHGLRFTGMNYPYGENIIFTDNHPILAYFLGLFNSDWINRNAVGIINSIMIYSPIITSTILYYIFRKLNLSVFLACVFAVMICFLSPQMRRYIGHYSLTYSFVIPMAILLLLMYYQAIASKQKIKIAGLLVAFTLLLSFIHMYYAAFVLFAASFYVLVSYLINFKNLKSEWQQNWLLIASMAVLVLFIFGFISSVDTFTDRVKMPSGFYVAKPSFKYIFHSNHFSILSKTFPNFPFFNYPNFWEGEAYIGTVSLLFVLFFGVFLLVRFGFKPLVIWNKAASLAQNQRFLLVMTAASFGIILFFMLITKRWLGKEYYFPFLTQFRTTARYSWVFFYAINITAVYGIVLFAKSQSKIVFKYLILVSAMVIFGLEAFMNTSYALISTQTNKNIFDKPSQVASFFKEKNPRAKYQALVYLPYFHQGSEKFNLMPPNNDQHVTNAFVFSLQLQLPLFNTILSRGSIHQALNQLSLTNHSLLPKNILADLPNNKPILIICPKANTDLASNDIKLLGISKPLGQTSQYRLYEYWPSLAPSKEKLSLKATINNQKLIYDRLYYRPNDALIFQEFTEKDSLQKASVYKETISVKNNTTEVFSGRLNYPAEASIWAKVDHIKFGVPLIEVYQNGKNQQLANGAIRDTASGWIRLTCQIPTVSNRKIKIIIAGENMELKNFMLRPSSVDLAVKHTANIVNFNNYPVDL